MLGVTLFGIFLTPVFYYVIQWFGDRHLEGRRSRGPSSRTEIKEPLAAPGPDVVGLQN